MKLSAKTRYGIAALTFLHLQHNEVTPLISIANHLNISKIYMEQVFSSLKNSGIVDAVKGPTGGYYIVDKDIALVEVMLALEPDLFKKTQHSTDDEVINQALCDYIYSPIDEALELMLSNIYLKDIAQSIHDKSTDSIMYYI